jgi:hypothetical protein
MSEPDVVRCLLHVHGDGMLDEGAGASVARQVTGDITTNRFVSGNTIHDAAVAAVRVF